ncbi:hypothetical protein BGZ99_003025 [Dissophora globulifera]|uniref:Zn(2)-C6 fungal-type domain-containing protein n=1 Tax=Dissophora globulifera TaxID=979702 RepID=A0A9P6RZL1_9FUNG|nr:hypothetical protein BGZ99_003025 [Dissophora globulifera]
MFNSPMLLDFNSNGSNQQKRSKITKACDNCRRRRVKCDGVPDGCGGCKAAKTQCVYTTSNTKRGPPKGYVEVIEDRLGKIENMLTSIVKKKNTASTSTIDKGKAVARSSAAPTAPALSHSDSDDSPNEDEDEDDHDEDDHTGFYTSDLVKVKQQPPASPALRPARSSTPTQRNIRSGSVAMSPLGRHSPLISRHRSLTSLLPFSHDSLSHHLTASPDHDSVTHADISALTGMFDKLGSTSVRTTVPFPWLTPEQSRQYGRNHLQFTLHSLEPPLPSLTRSFPPNLSVDQIRQLLESFFDRFNAFLPVVHRPTFMSQWEQYICPLCNLSTTTSSPQPVKTQQAQAKEVEAHKKHLQDSAAPLSPLLLNALLAVAARVPSTGSKMTADERQRSGALSQSFFDAARLLQDDYMDVPRVSTVQALCLMSQYHHQGQWKATRSSGYLSLAIRMAHELGLHRDPENIVHGPEADGLRFLWWSLFILDHQFSAWLGLGLMMHGKESDVELPTDPTSPTQDLRGFVCMVRLVKILGSVLQHSYSTRSLPPQFGGHDSMVSYIEGSLTSWLSNLAPEMRWQNSIGAMRGPPGSPMRLPPSLQASAAEAARAVILVRESSEVYPAYLYIVYNTTLILLHRPYIVGAAGSPAAAQSNTICTGSGRAITDIAQGLDMERCSYVVNRFALYALLQAGVIHAMNAVYDKRGSEVAMDYYQRTLRVLESFFNCSSYSGGVSEGIKILEQFLATTTRAAAAQEATHDGDLQDVHQQESDPLPTRKRRQVESVLPISQYSAASIQHTLSTSAALTSSLSAPIVTPTLSMLNAASMADAVLSGSGNLAHHHSSGSAASTQQHQQRPIDLKEQQKQQQLKIQQQHRLYQQMQTFGASAVSKPVEAKAEVLLEQQQQQQQQLMRQQLQRQQQRQHLEAEMKEQGANSLQYQQPVLNSMATPVIPSHRYALQMLQQQQQQHQQQHHSHPNMPMTMTGLTMEAQQKMNQDQLNMGSMISESFEYDPTKYWVDFTDSSIGPLNTAQVQQDPAVAVGRPMAESQFGGSLWM